MESIHRERVPSEALLRLRAYEQSGLYLFHGSLVPNVGRLELRQAHTWRGQERYEDGPPAVAASPYVDIAIFRALVQTGRSGFSSFDEEADGKTGLEFRLTLAGYLDALAATGYVYVLPRAMFESRNGKVTCMDWRSEEPVVPVDIVEVHGEDLPEVLRFYKESPA